MRVKDFSRWHSLRTQIPCLILEHSGFLLLDCDRQRYYVYVFFDTGVTQAFASIEYMTNEQWYAAGLMRSLHRYGSDALVAVMLLHILREFSRDRYRGVRWFSWVTGIPVLLFIYIAGISGYWLVWDTLAQYVAIVSTEWLDHLPFFGQPVARNFLSPETLENRFFTLMIFMHIAFTDRTCRFMAPSATH
jgi:quinol-cytochrome oxidoreductase complex cytochrome b subunit